MDDEEIAFFLELLNLKIAKFQPSVGTKTTKKAKPTLNNLCSSVHLLIFRFLSLQDILNCRLVCRKWRDILQNTWNRKAFVVIDSPERLSSFIDCSLSIKGSWGNFRLSLNQVMGPSSFNFFFNFAQNLHALEINKCFCYGLQFCLFPEATQNLRRLVLHGAITEEDCVFPESGIPSMKGGAKHDSFWPNLQYLEIDLYGYSKEKHARDLRIVQPFVYHLLLASPNLEDLIIKSPCNNFTRTVLHIVLFQDELNLRNLQKIDWGPRFVPSRQEMQLLQQRSFPLKELSLNVQCRKADVTAMHDLLSAVSSSLRHLRVHYLMPQSGEAWYEGCHSFPSSLLLNDLRTLTLTNFKGCIRFVIDMPKLQSCIVVNCSPTHVNVNINTISTGDVYKSQPSQLHIRLAPISTPGKTSWLRPIWLRVFPLPSNINMSLEQEIGSLTSFKSVS